MDALRTAARYTVAIAMLVIPGEAKRSRGMERLGKPRHRRDNRRLSEGE
jgi:hypothetical protein